MGKTPSKPNITYEEIQHIIDERMYEIIKRENAEPLKDDVFPTPEKKNAFSFVSTVRFVVKNKKGKNYLP